MKRAIVLLSGGLDSAVCLYEAKKLGFEPVALTLNYGQRHLREMASARKLVKRSGIRHYEVSFQMPWRGSSLTDSKMKLHEVKTVSSISSRIPNTYVPARNSVFLALAASCAEAEKAAAIFIGANAVDYSGYPDCRPVYLRAFENLIRRGTKAGVEGKKIKIFAPLLRMSKKQIVERAFKLGVPVEDTWSCYRGGRRPCGRCDSCLLRAKGFAEASMMDAAL